MGDARQSECASTRSSVRESGRTMVSSTWWTRGAKRSNHRMVFKFKLIAVEGDEDLASPVRTDVARRRIIPTAVKLEVWRRDGGKCVVCGSSDELHFDHVVPFSRGGTSLVSENIQLLCTRHNIEKHDKIL